MSVFCTENQVYAWIIGGYSWIIRGSFIDDVTLKMAFLTPPPLCHASRIDFDKSSMACHFCPIFLKNILNSVFIPWIFMSLSLEMLKFNYGLRISVNVIDT